MTRQQRDRLLKYGLTTVLTAAVVIYYAAPGTFSNLRRSRCTGSSAMPSPYRASS